jgi:hypothetical protein
MSRKEDEDKEEYAVNGQVKNLHGHLYFFSDAKDWNVLDMVMFLPTTVLLAFFANQLNVGLGLCLQPERISRL